MTKLQGINETLHKESDAIVRVCSGVFRLGRCSTALSESHRQIEDKFAVTSSSVGESFCNLFSRILKKHRLTRHIKVLPSNLLVLVCYFNTLHG